MNRQIWLEKLTKPYDGYITHENHTLYSVFMQHDKLYRLEEHLNNEGYNFLGVSKRIPYKCSCPSANMAFIIEDITTFEIYWFHCFPYWINMFLEELGSDFRWEENGNGMVYC